MELRGTVVVTGGSSGIGRAAVLACAEAGASMAVLDLDRAAAEATAAEARDRGAPGAIALECDVRQEASVAKAIGAAAEQLGSIRGLVACAGIDRSGLAHELDADQWFDVLNTNLTGTFLACKHVLIQMLEHGEGGCVVCTSSPLADVSFPGGASAYSASKGGVSAFVRSLALDYAPHGIRVNAIVPGATETPLMWANVPPADVARMRELTGKQIALGRVAEPVDIARGIRWLLSDEAAYMTGSHLVIDGGLLARGSIDV